MTRPIMKPGLYDPTSLSTYQTGLVTGRDGRYMEGGEGEGEGEGEGGRGRGGSTYQAGLLAGRAVCYTLATHSAWPRSRSPCSGAARCPNISLPACAARLHTSVYTATNKRKLSQYRRNACGV